MEAVDKVENKLWSRHAVSPEHMRVINEKSRSTLKVTKRGLIVNTAGPGAALGIAVSLPDNT